MSKPRKDPEWTPPLFGCQYAITRNEKLLEVQDLPRGVLIWHYDDMGWTAVLKLRQPPRPRSARGQRLASVTNILVMENHSNLKTLIRRFERRLDSLIRGLSILR